MNFNFYLEKLYSSDDYKKFMSENPDAYFCSAFFVVDFEGKENPDNKRHLDFYIPSSKKMFSFQLENLIQLVPVELYDERIPTKLNDQDFDFKDITNLITKEMERRDIKTKVQKILFSLQNMDGKNFILATVFISSLGILKVHIDISENEIILFEKKSFFDFVRKG